MSDRSSGSLGRRHDAKPLRPNAVLELRPLVERRLPGTAARRGRRVLPPQQGPGARSCGAQGERCRADGRKSKTQDAKANLRQRET
jgi:hypothetical protein